MPLTLPSALKRLFSGNGKKTGIQTSGDNVTAARYFTFANEGDASLEHTSSSRAEVSVGQNQGVKRSPDNGQPSLQDSNKPYPGPSDTSAESRLDANSESFRSVGTGTRSREGDSGPGRVDVENCNENCHSFKKGDVKNEQNTFVGVPGDSGDTTNLSQDRGSLLMGDQNSPEQVEEPAEGFKEAVQAHKTSIPSSDYEIMTSSSSLNHGLRKCPLNDKDIVSQGLSPSSVVSRSQSQIQGSDSINSFSSSNYGSYHNSPTVICAGRRPTVSENEAVRLETADEPQEPMVILNTSHASRVSRPESSLNGTSTGSDHRSDNGLLQAERMTTTVAAQDRHASRALQPAWLASNCSRGTPEAFDQELFPKSALNIPVGALRKSRRRLSLLLNIPQIVQDSGWTSDYRGLADMLGFDAVEIENFWECNPSDTLFREWAVCQDSRFLPPVFGTLVDCLEKLERQDILVDCRGLILDDVKDYVAEQQLLSYYAVQRLERFDCYVNIANEDILTIGREIVDTLEGVYHLKLCLTLRDVTLGGSLFDNMAEMLETRCNSKVLFVLTKNYQGSDACQFLNHFAITLDPSARKRKLIPLLVDEDAFIPYSLRSLAKLNYHWDRVLGLLWPKLVAAIRL